MIIIPYLAPSCHNAFHLRDHVMYSAAVTKLHAQVKLSAFEQRHEKTCFMHVCENKDTDQLRGNREADQRLYFRYIDSTV